MASSRGWGSFGEDPGMCTFEERQQVARLTPSAEGVGSQADEQLGVLIWQELSSTPQNVSSLWRREKMS